MPCPQCRFDNLPDATFCQECGAKLQNICPQCQIENQVNAKFCRKCGAALTSGQKVKPNEKERTKAVGAKAKGTKKKPRKRRSEETAKRPKASPQTPIPLPQSPASERRQLTVMFCDLVGSTALSAELDPEEYQAVVQAYQATCTTIIERYAGRIAQHLGDGILAYFGYPTAHEDDAARAVRASLEMLTAIQQLPTLPGRKPLQIRIGIHTGLVVVGEIGGGEKHEILALGETPNLAARLQGVADPNTVVLSAMTQRLVAGLFDCQPLEVRTLKGIATPLTLYRVVGESMAQHRLDVIQPTGLTPLVGREEELALLQRRWQQTLDREGQVVLLSGEPGIGKSRLVRELRERVAQDNALRIEFRCSPYYQNSAWQPIIAHLHRLLEWQKNDTAQTKLNKLQTTLARYHFPQTDTLPLFAALLSLPHPPDAPPLNMSPQRQKQKTEEALIAWLLEEAERAPLYCAWEDLHWADPSTLELLGRLIDQAPTARLFVLLTSRPEFTLPWGQHGHLSQLTLSRLGKRYAPQMIARVTGNKPLPEEVVQQIVAKTDGVPLFVEELTKMVLESSLLTETDDRYELIGPLPPLAIPSTLQDSLMARLDRLATTKELAQLGATIGREFSYELLQAVSPLTEQALQQGLQQLVEAELLYQRGTLPQASYLFKHALIQDTAYQSLFKSRRQQLHQQIAQVLETQAPETKETQPELLAHHYTEAGLIPQAIPYWQQAGLNAVQRLANVEAVSHLTTGLNLLKTLPDTSERARQELSLQLALGAPLIATKGYTAQEVEHAYTRARELCQLTGDTTQLFLVLGGLRTWYATAGRITQARAINDQLLTVAQHAQEPGLLSEAHNQQGNTLYWAGEFAAAHEHFERSLALYDPLQHRRHAALYGQDTEVASLSHSAMGLCLLGYPDQAVQRAEQALARGQECAHPFSLGYARTSISFVRVFRQEEHAVRQSTEALITLAREQGFPFWEALGTILRGWALTRQGQREEGIEQMREGVNVWRARAARPQFLALLAEAYGEERQPEEGLAALAEGFVAADEMGECYYEAELYRLKGELTLQLGARDSGLETSPLSTQASSLKSQWRWRKRRRSVSSKPSRPPGSNKPNRWNCARP